MNDNEQRDELARELFIADNSNQPREASIVDWEWFEATDKQRGQLEHYKNMAAGMIAAGYRKPRTITTVEELDALPNWSAILDSSGDVAQKLNGWWHFPETSPVGPSKVLKYSATVTVIHEPTIEATR